MVTLGLLGNTVDSIGWKLLLKSTWIPIQGHYHCFLDFVFQGKYGTFWPFHFGSIYFSAAIQHTLIWSLPFHCLSGHFTGSFRIEPSKTIVNLSKSGYGWSLKTMTSSLCQTIILNITAHKIYTCHIIKFWHHFLNRWIQHCLIISILYVAST